jgi:2-polyprenyl-6-methoxyphenol hydroxylase-like FAD-dependent oxidoreductase
MASDLPVLVAGAGPVGVSTALLLARWGVPTVVLEAEATRDAVGSKAICMQRDVLDVFGRIGVADAMLAEGVTWWRGRTYYRLHELFETTFPELGPAALPPWINISQGSTERYLFERVAETPEVDVRFGHRVTGVDQDGEGVSVSVEGGSSPLRARWLVAADGGRSTVRALLGVSFPGQSFADQFLIADIRADLPFPSERRFYFDPEWNPGRQVLVHEQPDRVWRIDWQVPGDYDLEAERASGALDERIRRIVGDTPYEIVWLSVYHFHERCAETFHVGRTFLVGDAAHLYAPFGARGLNSGMQDAENLAWKLAFVHHGWAEDSDALLATYDLERRPAALTNLAVTSATMEFLVPQTEAQWAWRRATLERAVTDPDARRLIDSGKLAEPFWYLDSPLTTPAEADEVEGFPTGPGLPRPPIPGVLCPDGPVVVAARPEVTRLRQVFGSGFVVLTARADRAAPAAAVARRAVAPPTMVHALPQLDPTGELEAGLAAGPDSVHVVRPDGHLAAVLSEFDEAALTAALRRAAGHFTE